MKPNKYLLHYWTESDKEYTVQMDDLEDAMDLAREMFPDAEIFTNPHAIKFQKDFDMVCLITTE